jgi:hypothetical protein
MQTVTCVKKLANYICGNAKPCRSRVAVKSKFYSCNATLRKNDVDEILIPKYKSRP